MRIALVHYWLVAWRGGERVLKAIADLFPEADIFTHVADPRITARFLPGRRIHCTFIGSIPLATRFYRAYLPLMPLALEQLDLRKYDLVISSESGPAKGVIVDPATTHICYCHSPMRYVWDLYHDYREHAGALTKFGMAPILHYLRMWDQLAAQRVDHFVANSNFVGERIRKYYGRESTTIYPPVAVDQFDSSSPSEDFYLSVGQLTPYKRPDLLVEAFNQNGKRLVVIGTGEMLRSLRRRAKPNIELIGSQASHVVRDHYARCRALVFPGVEDLGIVPLEAMASGKPVIAFAKGGVLETVVDGVTGLFFYEQTAAALCEAVSRFENGSSRFSPDIARMRAATYSDTEFQRRFGEFVRAKASLKGTTVDLPAFSLPFVT